METVSLHALRSPDETYCGRPGLAVDHWTETADEITCRECKERIPKFTADELNAAIDPALEQLAREWTRSQRG
jgi:hypothetical protein